MDQATPTPVSTPKRSIYKGVIPFVIVGSLASGFVGASAYEAIRGKLLPATSTVSERRAQVIAEGEVVTDVAKKVSPSVVSIVVKSSQSDPYFGSTYQEGAGTGIIISKDGYILTNKHVVGDNVTHVQVVTTDGKTYDDVKVIGRDPVNDLAFLKISDVSDLTPAILGDSSKLVVGSKVVAIGNALGEFQTTVTSGIISGVNRSVTAGDETSYENLSNLIQTDAAINPGNSGGPLVNITGEVIGINTAVSQGAEGIGFAIPINEAKGLIKGVLEKGTIERSYLGVRYVSLTPEVAKRYNLKVTQGAYITPSDSGAAIAAGSPAEKAGLREGDVITKVNGVSLSQSTSLVSQLSQFAPGDKVTLTILRGSEQEVQVTLGKYQ